MAKDIEGVEIDIGDVVYYARKQPGSAKGLLVKRSVTKIKGNHVYMDRYVATDPENQIVIRKKVRKKKLEKLTDE